jgi:hypothetical protein
MDDVLSGIGLGKNAIGGSDDRGRAAGGCGAPFSGAEGGSGSSRSTSRGTGEAVTVSWPSRDEWDAYGLSGLAQPAGSTVINVALYQGTYYVSMVDAGKEAYADLTAQIKKITGATTPYSLIKSENGEVIEYQFGDHLVSLIVDYVDRELVIRVLR